MTVLDRSSDAPSGAFPGFGEGAPLNLPNLNEAAERAIVARLVDGSFNDWADAAAQVANCAHPIRLVGSSETFDTRTGEVVGSFSSADAPLGVLHVACGNRRADVCAACARTYARDMFELIRAGVRGGKTIAESVGDNPLLFATFTAPSFGHVHGHRDGKRCRPRDRAMVCVHGRPAGCMAIHTEADPMNGSPICVECYDWHTAVIWQWWAPELWRRTLMALRRALAKSLGLPADRLADGASLQFAKVAEYQARGLIHFHALIRLDGVDGPGSPSPLDGSQLARIVQTTVPQVTCPAAAVDDADTDRTLTWGRQLDVKIVRPGSRTDDPDAELSADQVAGYLAKYATKDANSIRRPGEQIPHLRRMEATCRELADRARTVPDSEYRLLGKWARMLGFRGHFATKSRAYSLTLGRLRRARQRFQVLAADSRRTGQPLDTRDLEARLLADDEETTLVIGSWAYQGTGWTRPGDEALALAAAARAREYDQWRAQERRAA